MLMKTLLAVCLAGAALITTACPERRAIGDIESNPGKYHNKEVAVAGVVKESYGVSVPGTRIGGGVYKIDDGTGSIWVVVSEGAVPQKGAEIGVKGRVGTGINWNGRNYGLGIHEKDRRYAKR